jgi:hypothetical protein
MLMLIQRGNGSALPIVATCDFINNLKLFRICFFVNNFEVALPATMFLLRNGWWPLVDRAPRKLCTGSETRK